MLDLVLAVGERISRIASSGDDYIPIRPPAEAIELESGSRSRARGAPDHELAD